jgi:hypothetical protein
VFGGLKERLEFLLDELFAASIVRQKGISVLITCASSLSTNHISLISEKDPGMGIS